MPQAFIMVDVIPGHERFVQERFRTSPINSWNLAF